MDPVRVGVVGTNWGRMHVGAFRAAGAHVAALCGHDLARTRDVAAQEGIPLATTDVHALCRAVDLVVVASPDALHAAHVEAALDAGRAVVCEKPLTRTDAEARALLARARAHPRPCLVNFPYRQLAPFQALRAHLAASAPLLQLVVTLRNGFVPVDAQGPTHPGSTVDAGPSADFGGLSHLLDAALWLTGGTPAWVQASLTGRPVHTAALHVGLTSGAVLVLTHAACAEPGLHGGWSVLGQGWEAGLSAGYVPALGGWVVSPVRAWAGGAWRDLAPGLAPQPGRPEPWAAAHGTFARAVLARLQGGAGADGLAGFEDGARVQALLAAALRSQERGARVAVEDVSAPGAPRRS